MRAWRRWWGIDGPNPDAAGISMLPATIASDAMKPLMRAPARRTKSEPRLAAAAMRRDSSVAMRPRSTRLGRPAATSALNTSG